MTEPLPTTRPTEQPWELLAARLARVARGLTRNPDEADDLVQETISRLLTQPQGLHEGYAVTALTRTWLARRRSMRRMLARLKRVATDLVVARPSPAADGEDLERVRRVVATLPDRQRAALVLRTVAGLDYAAIARSLECDVAAVRANLHLARAKVRRQCDRPRGEAP